MNAYDVLYDNLPDYFKPIQEFIQILKSQGYAADKLDGNVQDVYNNFFVQTADAATLTYYEQLLNIIASPDDTILYRRKRIIQQLSLVPQFDINWLKNKLNGMYGKDGYELEVDAAECTLSIEVKTGINNAVQMFYDFIWGILPAHIEMSAQQNVSTNIESELKRGIVLSSTVMTVINSPTVYSTDISVGIYSGSIPSGTKMTVIGGISNGNI